MEKNMKIYGVFLLIFFFSSCQAQQENLTKPIEPLDVVYPDGIFRGEYDVYDNFGWKPFIEIQIRGGVIVSATWDEVNAAGEFKSQNQWYTDTMKKNVGLSPVEAANELIDRMVARNGADIDAVVGATISSKRFKELAQAVLNNILQGIKQKTVISMNDTYKVESDVNSRGLYNRLEVTYENGKIKYVRFDLLDLEGKSFREGNSDESKKWNAIAVNLERQLIEKQDYKLLTPPPDGENQLELMKGLMRRIMQKRENR